MQSNPVVLFDGVCNYCNGIINFVLKQDKKGRFRFATLQSEAGKQLLQQHGFPADYNDSFILIANGTAYTRSDASLRVLNGLPWYWKPVQLFRIIPRRLRDVVYDFIARRRYRWFGKRDACMIPTADVRDKFLTDERINKDYQD